MAGQEAKAAYADEAGDGEAVNDNQPAAAKLLGYLQVPNLVTEITEEQRTEIARKCIEGYKLDDASRTDWKERTDGAIKLAMLLADEKDYPFKGAANVKYPLLTTAALQFNARTYPAIIQNDRVARCKVNGHDPQGIKAQRAERVSEHMSWQLLTEMPEWEPDTDRLLLIVPIVGSAFRKRYWDPTLKRQCSRLVTADRLVMNYRSRSIKDTPRISEELYLYPYEIEERIRDGRFESFEYGEAKPEDNEGQTDADSPHKFIEQHRLYDLDGDGYPEPYIATVHCETEKLCRLVPNYDETSVTVTPEGKVAAVRKRDYYVQYSFLPSPDGGIYGMGFGWLLLSTNEAINTTLNEMLDAGHLSNLQAGFISSAAGLKDKTIRLGKGEFKVLNTNMPVNQAVSFAQFPGPSEVLFKLLGLLIEQGREISATKDVMTGDTGGKVMQPTTVMALIEQGMKVFNAITKRVFRALKDELQLHAELNEKNLTPEAYNEFFDGPEPYDPKADYNAKDMNVTPVSDPAMATQMQKVAKSQVIREIAGPPGSKPWINYPEIDKRAFEAVETDEPEKLFAPPPQPDPQMVAFQKAMQDLTLQEFVEKIEKLKTEQLKNIADAEAAEEGTQMSAYEMIRQYLMGEHQMEQDNNAQAAAALQSGGLPGMEGQPNDAGGAPAAQGASGGNGTGPAGPDMELGGAQVPARVGSGPAPASPSQGAM